MKRIIFPCIFLGSLVLSCQNHDNNVITEKSFSFKLASGESLSLSGYIETSPYIVQGSEGKLHLFFLSNRPCPVDIPSQSCANLNFYYAQSTTTYTGGEIPAFETPKILRDQYNNAIYLTNERNLLVLSESPNYRILYNYPYLGFVNSILVNPVQAIYSMAADILPEGGAYLLGGTTHNNNLRLIYSTKDNLSHTPFYLIEREGSQSSILPLAFWANSLKMESAVYLPKVSEQTVVGEPVFLVIDGLLYFGFTQTMEFYPFDSFNLALAKDGLLLRKLGLLLANNKADDNNSRLIFSAAQGNEVDLYAVRNLSLKALSRTAYQEITRAGRSFTPFAIPAPAGGMYLYLYVTQNTYTGDLGGIAGADAKCNSDPAKPPVGQYKAFIVSSDRKATTTGVDNIGQQDWVLVPIRETDYIVYSTKLPVFKTNHHGLIGHFYPHKLLHSQPTNFWTGMGLDMQNSSNNCSNWSSSSGTGETGEVGNLWADSLAGGFLSAGSLSCSTQLPLLCVQQPE